MEKLLRLSDIAKLLHCHKVTVASWVKSGRGPKNGVRSPTGTLLFPESAVSEWLAGWKKV